MRWHGHWRLYDFRLAQHGYYGNTMVEAENKDAAVMLLRKKVSDVLVGDESLASRISVENIHAIATEE
jgi:hypothetical protein